jgi:hypothetical protein
MGDVAQDNASASCFGSDGETMPLEVGEGAVAHLHGASLAEDIWTTVGAVFAGRPLRAQHPNGFGNGGKFGAVLESSS